MDSRIEELSEVIIERCQSVCSALDNSGKKVFTQQEQDKYRLYRRIDYLATEILLALGEYRCTYPKEYK